MQAKSTIISEAQINLTQPFIEKFHFLFSDQVDEQLLVDEYNKNIRNLSQLISNSLTQKTSHSVVLYGQHGFGRKSAIRKAIANQTSNKNKILKLFINAYLHSSEKNILQYIQFELTQQTKLHQAQITKLAAADLNQYFEGLKNKFDGMVIVIDRIEILATVKKQFFLYSLFEWVRETKFPIIFVGITTDLLFSEKLEKRVKSRFQHTPFYFMNIDFDFLKSILSVRLDQLENNQLKEAFCNLIDSGIFKYFFQRFERLQFSYSKIILFFKSSLSILQASLQSKKPFDHLEDVLEETEKLIVPNLKKQLCKSLAQPEFVVLFSLFNLIQRQKPQIMFDDIIQHTEKAKISYLLKNHSVGSFSPFVLNRALDNLIKLNLVILQNPQTKNLENNQIILCVPMDDVQDLIKYAQENLSDFITYHASFQ